MQMLMLNYPVALYFDHCAERWLLNMGKTFSTHKDLHKHCVSSIVAQKLQLEAQPTRTM